jgi:hypothetical protein
MKNTTLKCLSCALVLALSAARPALAADDSKPQEPSSSFADELSKGFYSRINLLGFGLYQKTRDPQPTPGTGLLIPRYQAEFDVRPDFNLNIGRFEFGLKPRFQYAWTRVHPGSGAEIEDTDQRSFINEGFARFRITDEVLAIYGRENLQWGPSSLLSPSNPFNANNGKSNPHIEQPGLDYARLVGVLSPQWSVSLIANTGSGRLEQTGPFEKTSAVKVDYTGDGYYFSALSSYRENDRHRLGFFGGWDASTALLVYFEGSAAKKERSSTRDDYKILVGGSYTLEAGPTITLEYFHNNSGCTLEPVALCLVQQPLNGRFQFLRRRYVLLQYLDTKIGGNLNLAARLTRNMDDASSQLTLNFEYELGRHWQLIALPAIYSGRQGSELGSLLRYSMFVGASYTF